MVVPAEGLTPSPGGVTCPRHPEGVTTFSASLEPILLCPRRYHLEKVRREPQLAPFAASELGKLVHRRIAASLRFGEPADEGSFHLPRRVLLRQGEDLEELVWRAHSALAFYNVKCRA